MKSKRLQIFLVAAFCILGLGVSGCERARDSEPSSADIQGNIAGVNFPEGHADSAYVVLNDNIPVFSEEEIATESYEQYSELDDLGRCGTAFACVGIDLMPVEERGNIGQVKPSGWHTIKYDIVDGKYLYNRCHLIGYQLSGENANEKNLITGTRYLNVVGMLPFEDMVADYVTETQNHVMYRVTPVFEENNLLASGVQMEAYSVEDSGKGISFNVFVYNRQPGIIIDYKTGESYLDEAYSQEKQETAVKQSENRKYVININTMRFHLPDCDSVNQMKEENRKDYEGTREYLIENGYVPCGNCRP
ncbi:MAG: DNA/RNA non-specific endonuclease [Clostridium sp.]|nr:DNA/RNA non-specific endonuclease [Clostridium sp.]